MTSKLSVHSGPYALQTGASAARRLHVLHNIYAPAGRRILRQAGLRQGMRVADFGCGVGVTTRMLAEMVGPSGSVTGIDLSAAQLQQAGELCAGEGLTNTAFVKANACKTGLPRKSVDLAYCRFLLLHLPDPAACLREMREVLRPGGILVVEDGDLGSATSVPPTAMDAFAELFCRFGPVRGLDFSLARNLYHMVIGAGFSDVNLEIHQPAILEDENRPFLKWSVEEAGASFVDAGIVTREQLERTLAGMQEAVEDRGVLILAPRMSIVWARKDGG